ncbi:MAG: MMPL family transporter, partial [Clostridia bacterium]
RLFGLIANFALVFNLAMILTIMSWLGASLTLPGIAGIVIGIGMAVDANVVVFERIKEEIRGGKSAKAAIKSGYSHAFSAVLDSNITTFIAAGVLYVLGSGTIRGFAVTLGLGVLISFFTAIVLTRLLLNLGCDMGLVNINLYGVKERSTEQ